MDELTHASESSVPSLKGEWKVTDSPEGYVSALRKAVIGVEIKIDRLEGKWKMSQEMGEADRRGVVEGLRNAGERGESVAELVQAKGEKK